MNWLFPVIERKLLAPLLGLTALGGMVGGIYGASHDLFTFAISAEYFTKLKFTQFAWADLGFSPRWYAMEVGFIATGAVGLAAGWFLARTVLPRWSGAMAGRKSARAFFIVLVMALLGGGVGYWLGLRHTPDYSEWRELCESLGVSDAPAFVRVAYIHNAGYLGGFSGLLAAVFWLRASPKNPPIVRGGG